MPARPYRVIDYQRRSRDRLMRRLREENAREIEGNNEQASDTSEDEMVGVDDADAQSDVSVGSVEAPDANVNISVEEIGEPQPSSEEETDISDHDIVMSSDDSMYAEDESSGAEDNNLNEDNRATSESDEETGSEDEQSGEDEVGQEEDQGHDQEQEDENGRNRRPGDNAELFPGAPVTVGESLFMVLTFALNHNLSGKCIGDLLQLIANHCPVPNNCVKTLYYFKKYFSNMDMPLRRHFYCSSCYMPLENEDVCNQCQNSVKSYFITLPLIPQLQSMFKRERFHEKLRYRFECVKTNEDSYEDIFDGEIYQEYSRDGGFLSDPNAISFCWNSDGVPIFKSFKYSIWPFFLRINELPYHDRVRKENILLGALWFGPKKPLPNAFLLPLLPDIQRIRDGIMVQIPQHENLVRIRGIVLCGTCDMPAKALFLNFKSYNGYFGCTVCKQRGARNPDNKHVYRYEHRVTLRTDEETEDFAAAAMVAGEAVVGVKGPTIVSRFVPRPVASTAIDPMHKYSGVVEKLMVIWLTPKYSEHPVSISHFVRLIERRLLALKPPGFVERLPRSLAHLSYFKISEFFCWLFYYSLVILKDLMTPQYFNHYQMLVYGLYLLNNSSVSPEDVELASSLLTEFVVEFEDLYGLEHMTCNIHQLQHLPDYVKRLGPLWTVTCAPFESMNGTLKKFVHGTRYADLQVCTAATLYVDLAVFKDRFVREEGVVQAFCDSMVNNQKRLKLIRITDTVSAADKLCTVHPIPPMIQNALIQANVEFENVYLFKKAFTKRKLFIAESYTRTRKTNSSCVKFSYGNSFHIGLIQSFVRIANCACNCLCQCPATCYAIVKILRTQNSFTIPDLRAVLSFVYECHRTDQIVAVRVENFISLCFYMAVDDIHKWFAVETVNSIETDD